MSRMRQRGGEGCGAGGGALRQCAVPGPGAAANRAFRFARRDGHRGSWRNDGDAVGKGAPGPGCRRYLHARCIETFPTRTHRRKKHPQFTRRHRAIEDATALAIDLWAGNFARWRDFIARAGSSFSEHRSVNECVGRGTPADPRRRRSGRREYSSIFSGTAQSRLDRTVEKGGPETNRRTAKNERFGHHRNDLGNYGNIEPAA